MDLDLSRVRRPSRWFGWIDRRILTEGHLADLSPVEVAVYLILCVLADRHGVSCYAHRTLAGWIKHPPDNIRDALASLARRNLVAMVDRYVQVVDVDLLVKEPASPALLPAVGTNPAPVPEEPPPETARQKLVQLPAEVQEELVNRARARLIRFTQGREPLRSVVEALAASLLDEEVA